MVSVVKSCKSVEACTLGLRTQLRTAFSVPFNTLDACGYKVEEDDGSPQLQSIWQQMQANRKGGQASSIQSVSARS